MGNALWRESFLLKRIAREEAEKLCRSIFAILQAMDVAVLENEDLGAVVLDMAGRLNITYYDAAYLAEAERSGKTLVTDDEKLAKAAENAGVKNITSKALSRQ